MQPYVRIHITAPISSLPSPVIHAIIDAPKPTARRTRLRDNAQATGSPERRNSNSSTLDRPPGPTPPAANMLRQGVLVLPSHRDGGGAEPAGPAPHHVSGAEVQQGSVGGPALDLGEDGGDAREPVGHELQADVGAVALDEQRDGAVDGDVGGEQAQEQVPRGGDVAERGPGPGPAPADVGVVGDGGAVALEVLLPSDEAQRDARGDVGEDGEADEEGLGDRRLVDLARHDEEGLRVGHRPVDQRDDGRVGDVQAGEHREGVARVALDARHCFSHRRVMHTLLPFVPFSFFFIFCVLFQMVLGFFSLSRYERNGDLPYSNILRHVRFR